MKWYNSCSFCDFKEHQHQDHCIWRKVLRVAKWSNTKIVIALDARRAQLPTRE